MPIIVADSSLMSAVAFGRPSRDSIDRDIERLDDLRRNLIDDDDRFSCVERVRDSLDRLFDEDIELALRDIDLSTTRRIADDRIGFLTDTFAIADAPIASRRWLLANKRLGRAFRQQRVDGWGASKDFYRIGPNDNDPYYDEVMSGVLQTDTDTGEVFAVNVVFNDIPESERLTQIQRHDLLGTFAIIDSAMEDGIDPTSPYGDPM